MSYGGDNFTGVIVQPGFGYPTGGTGGYGVEMQPLLTSPAAVAAALMQRLSMLEPFSELYIDDDGDDIKIVDTNGKVILKCDTQTRAGDSRRGNIGGTVVNFNTESGQIIFTTVRENFSLRATAGDFALGNVEGDCCGCDRGFEAKSADGEYSKLQFNPTGCISSIGCSCCNSCCINEYIIVSDNGIRLGQIQCGDRKKITFDAAVNAKTKALIIAASLFIYELYFAPCCGNVGLMGSRYICSYSFILITIVVVAIIITVKILTTKAKN